MSTTIGDFVVRLVLSDDDFERGAANATKTFEGLGQGASDLADNLGGVLAVALAAAGAAMAAFAYESVQVGMGFEASIQKVGVLAGGVDGAKASIEALGAEARRLGGTTAYSAKEAADAMQGLAGAGLKTNEIIAATNSALLLAGASGSSLGDSTSILITTMAQFGLSASEAGRISDVFSQAMNVSTLDMGSLTEAMKYAGTVGRSFGYSLEQTTAAVALFRDLGLEGSKAGTAFRNALSQASSVSKAGEKALSSYGLTVEQINPELHTFAEIMTTIGAAHMTTTDLIKVFGQEAAGSVSVLAASFADGTTKFTEYLDAFNSASGSTEATYTAMTDTLEGRVANVSSAFEELQLTLFSTYGEPLKALLVEVANLVAYVATSFSSASGEIGSGFASQVETLVGFLADNRQSIALGFQSLVKSVVDLGAAFLAIMPYLDDIAAIMAAIFVANRVRLFIAFVMQLAGAFTTLGATAEAAYIAISAATGGTFALIGAVVTFIGVLGAYVLAQNSAADAADRLRAAEQQLAAEQAARAAQQAEHAAAIEKTQAASLGAYGLELQSRGELSNAIDGQLSKLSALTDAQIAAGLASGDLFETTINGNRVVLDHASALELAVSGTTGYEQAQADAAAAQARLAAEQENAEERLAAIEAAQERYNVMTRDGIGVNKFYDSILAKHGATQEEVTLRTQEYAKQVETARKAVERFATGEELAEQALQKRLVATGEATTGLVKDTKATGDAGNAAKDYASKLAAATEARIALTKRLADEVVKSSGNETAILLADLAKREEEVRKVYDAEIALVRRNASKIRDLQAKMEQDIATVRSLAQQKQLADTTKLVDGIEGEFRKLRQTDEQEEQVANDEKRTRLAEEFGAEAALYEQGSEERLAVNRRFLAALALLDATEGMKRAEVVAKADRDATDKIEALRQASATRITQIENDKAAALASIERASGESRAALAAVYDQRVVDERAKISDEIRVLTGRETDEIAALEAEAASSRSTRQRDRLRGEAETLRKISALERERAAKLVEYADASESEKAEIADTYERKISDVRDEASKEAASSAKATIASIGREAASVLSSIASTAADIVGAIGGALGDLFSTLTGGVSFSIGEGVSSYLADIETARNDLQSQLDAGTMTPEEFSKGLSALDPGSAAREFVEGLISGAVGFASTLADYAPGFIDALVTGIPVLVGGLVAAIPEIVGAIATGLPALLDTLVTAIPTLIQAVVDALPVLVDALVSLLVNDLPKLLDGLGPVISNLIDAIVAAIPELISAATAALPSVIDVIVGAIEQIIAAIPEIVSSLLAALPTIITTLLAGIGNIITALIDAIPGIIQAVIENIPTIILALVNGVLSIVQKVVAALPALLAGIIDLIPELITALIGMIGDLVVSIIEAIPVIITGLLDALPVLITSLIQLLPDLIMGLVDALPKLITSIVGALINSIPEVTKGIIGAIPDIIFALVEGLITSIPALLTALFYDLPKQLGTAIGEAIYNALKILGQFFKDVIDEITSLGTTETQTFGDTPGAVRAGSDGLLARFAPGDTVIAAQRPMEVLRQALEATGANLGGMAAGFRAPPAPAASSPATASAPIDIAIMAEGRLLDAVQITALDRGHAPRLEHRLRRASGVTVGVDRGRFSPYTS